jgi:hypothetical protein
MRERKYLIWSLEHRAWWRANSHGYVKKREQAGEYTLSEAIGIVTSANIRCGDVPMEAMIPSDNNY